ncbi:MAG TPA: hypothetical protein VFZ16_04960 [Hyphomicrobiaceae bacterium]|nr:hypothetical protein [Hyphomicrobiaceae bacterium]
MKVSSWLALAVCLIGFGCAKAQTADPSPVLADQSELMQIRQMIAPCLRKAWKPPTRPRAFRLTLRWLLDEDGKVVGEPEVVQAPGAAPDSPIARSAMQAVRACAPYRLPVAKYHLWKEIVFNFDTL